MKKVSTKLLITVGVLVLIMIPTRVSATQGQWSASGSIIYYSDGNVGLGTNSPIQILDLVKNASDIALRLEDSGTSTYSIGIDHSDWGKLKISSNPYDVGTSTLMSIDLGGKVGFGTVEGNYQDLDIVNNASDVGMRLEDSGTSTFSIGIDHSDGGKFKIQTNPVIGSGFNIFTADTAGNVGIGTFNVGSYKFSVNGSIHAKSVIVNNNGWADYVFNDNYNLMSLTELDQYIKLHNHLPGISPAEEVESTGQDLGEIQTKQMEKIEELTLYIIQQDKKISNLEERLVELEHTLNVK